MASDNQVALSRPPRISMTNVPKNARPGVPAFLQKLYNMLNSTENQDLIRWSDAGDSFFVLEPDRFAKEMLGRWFKHQNFSSFVRQLNMYGFHKIPHLQQGVLHSDGDNEYWNFEHQNFRRSQPDMLCLIQRKKQTNQQPMNAPSALPAPSTGPSHGTTDEGSLDVRDPTTPTPQSTASNNSTTSGQVLDVSAILNGIAAIKRHQTTISDDLNHLKESNKLLWHESLEARGRLQKQQDVINRIVRFLAGVFGNQASGSPHGHGHNPHEKVNDPTRMNQGAVVPVRSGSVPRQTAGKPRLMIEGVKRDSSGKIGTSVGIVEVVDQEAGGHGNHFNELEADDDDELFNGDDEFMEDMNMNTPAPAESGHTSVYAVETPASIPSPSPSIAQSDILPGPTIGETTNIHKSNNAPPSALISSPDTIMHDSSQQQSSTSNYSNATTTSGSNRSVTPSRLTSTPTTSSTSLPNAPAFEIDPRTLLSNMTPEHFISLLASLSQNDNSAGTIIDPNLGFITGQDDGHQLTAFNPSSTSGGSIPSPTSFDFMSLPGLSSPSLPGINFHPAIAAGSSELPEHSHSDNGDVSVGTISPRMERHWTDVQDVENEVAASESQINQLMESFAPLLGGLPSGIVDAGMSTESSTNLQQGGVSPNLTTSGTKTRSQPPAASSLTSNDSGDAEASISSLDPTNLSLPTNLHHTDFDFDSFFPAPSSPSSCSTATPTLSHQPSHRRSTSTSQQPLSTTSSSGSTNLNLTNTSGIIDSTMDSMDLPSSSSSSTFGNHNHPLAHFPNLNGIDMSSAFSTAGGATGGGYNDLSGAEMAFLDEVLPSPSSPLVNTKTTSASTASTIPTSKSTKKGEDDGAAPKQNVVNSRKRKSEVISMGELEGALLGDGEKGSGGDGGEIGGVKVKRRKD